MSIRHHLGEDTQFAYAVGALGPGASLVIAAHLGVCAACRKEASFLAAVGAAVMASEPPAALVSDAPTRAAAAPDVPRPPVRAEARDPVRRALQGHAAGAWIWAGPGLRIARVASAEAEDERVYLLRGKPGVRLPQHGHEGMERVYVIQGAFVDGERFGAGDFCETDCVSHQPVAAEEEECICLIATEGRLHFGGVARWVAPLLGM